MKKKPGKNLWLTAFFREVARTPARFLSIAAISFIAVSFFAGVRAAAPDMRLTMDRYLDESRMPDLCVVSTSGLSSSQVRAVSQVSGVEAVMPAISQDVMMDYGQPNQANVKLLSLPVELPPDLWTDKPAALPVSRYEYDPTADWLGAPEVVEGTLPGQRGEIALDARFARLWGVKVGTRVTCATSSGSREMVVSGLVDSPYYVGLDRGSSRVGTGSSQGFAYAFGDDIVTLSTRLPLAALLETTYTQLWVKVEGADSLDAFSQAYEDRVKQVSAALEDLGEQENGSDGWYVLNRGRFSADLAEYAQNADRIAALGVAFPLIFFVVAILVSLTTMTRMVEEQRTQMGTYKALGYTTGSVASKYLAYAGVAALVGGSCGFYLGFWLFPTVIITVYRIMYTLPALSTPFHGALAAQSLLAVLACVLGGTWAACYSAMRVQPATLMRPKAPPMGKRVLLESIGPLWRRLGFNDKVTARNLFRYKKRFFMSVFGIAGSCALIMTGFGLRDSISLSVKGQFDKIWNMDAIVSLSKGLPREEFDESCGPLFTTGDFSAVLTGYQQLGEVNNTARPEVATVKDCYLMAVGQGQEQTFQQMVNLTTPQGESVTLDDTGVIITQKLARLAHVSAGDTISFEINGIPCQARVAAVVINYVQHYVYMTQGFYESITSQQMPYSAAYVTLVDNSETSQQQVAQRLYEHPRVAAVNFLSSLREKVDDSLSAINTVVLVLVVSSAALAFVVLYNLTNINIEERSRELATLRVLGFNDKEMYDYIFRENYLITAIGIAAGLLLGAVLHSFVITTCEIDIMMFVRRAAPASYLYSAVLTAVFSVLVNLTMRRRIRAVDMVESLKSIE